MAATSYSIDCPAGGAAQALGNDAGAFTIRPTGPIYFGESTVSAANGLPIRPEDQPFTVTLEAGESIWGLAPVTANHPAGTVVTVKVFKNTT